MTWRFVFFKNYFFVLTYVYVSSMLLSSENICGTRSYEWDNQLIRVYKEK